MRKLVRSWKIKWRQKLSYRKTSTNRSKWEAMKNPPQQSAKVGFSSQITLRSHQYHSWVTLFNREKINWCLSRRRSHIGSLVGRMRHKYFLSRKETLPCRINQPRTRPCSWSEGNLFKLEEKEKFLMAMELIRFWSRTHCQQRHQSLIFLRRKTRAKNRCYWINNLIRVCPSKN